MISSFGRFQNSRGKKYYPSAFCDDYPQIGIQKPNSRLVKHLRVHRVVHILFNDPELQDFAAGKTVDHKDRNRGNCSAGNLQWATAIEQCANRKNAVRTTEITTTKRVEVRSGDQLRIYCSIKAAATALETTRDLLMSRHFVRFVPDDNLDGELWKVHPLGCEVSNMGRYSGDGFKKYVPAASSGGYATVCFKQSAGARQKKLRVTNLVLEAFGFNKSNVSDTADHIDRDRSNNRLDNLRWASKRDQAKNRRCPKEKHTMCKVKSQEVGTDVWTTHRNIEEASKARHISTQQIYVLATNRKPSRKLKMNNGKAYVFKMCRGRDLEGEMWKVINVADWLPGGKYGSV